MGESVHIAEMAALASGEIFSAFGWEQLPLTDQNWSCVENQKHHKVRSSWKKHPTDVVFKYVDPYRGSDVYVNTDLKSYAKGTLDSADFVKVLKSLGHSTECADKSQEWKQLYVDQTRNHEVIGMLFVYNHDGEYDQDFSERLANIAPSALELTPGHLVGVVGPKRVIYLNSVAKDIKSLYSDEYLPAKEHRFFYFPHLQRAAALHQESPSVGLPFLLGPLIVLGYDFPDKPRASSRGYFVYYDGAGVTIEEFKYLFDYFFKYQIADEHTKIVVCMVFPNDNAHPTFEAAKREFARDHWPVGDRSRQEFDSVLKQISFRQVQSIIQRFSQKDLGMKAGKGE